MTPHGLADVSQLGLVTCPAPVHDSHIGLTRHGYTELTQGQGVADVLLYPFQVDGAGLQNGALLATKARGVDCRNLWLLQHGANPTPTPVCYAFAVPTTAVTDLDGLDTLIAAAGGHNAFARAHGIPPSTLVRWRASAARRGAMPQRLLTILDHVAGRPLATSPDSRPRAFLAGDDLRRCREQKGLLQAEMSSLMDVRTDTLKIWEESSVPAEFLVRARLRVGRLPDAMFLSGDVLTAVRARHDVTLHEAALALGIAKTTIFRLEQGLVSQHLVDKALTRFPLIDRHDAAHAGQRLANLVADLGWQQHQAQALVDLPRKAWTLLAATSSLSPLHQRVSAHLHAAAEARPTSTRVPLVDGAQFTQARREQHLSIEEAAALLGVSISRWSQIERTWGRQPLLRRLEALGEESHASKSPVDLKAGRQGLSLSLKRLAATAEMTTAQALQIEDGVKTDVIGHLRLAASLHRLGLIKARETARPVQGLFP